MDEEKRITYDYRYGAPNSDKAAMIGGGGGGGGNFKGGSNMPAVTPLPGPVPPEIRLPDQQVFYIYYFRTFI